MIVYGGALLGQNQDTLSAIGAAYDPDADTWRRLPDSTLSPQASTAAWDGREMIAWDYLNASAAYDPGTNSWRELPNVPVDAVECVPHSIAIGHDILGECASTVLFERDHDRWRETTLPGSAFVELVAAGEVGLVPARELRTDEIHMFAFRPPGASVAEAVLTEGTSNGVAWSLVAVTDGGQSSLELRAAKGEDLRLPFSGTADLRATARGFGEGDPDDVVVFGFVPPGTLEVRLVPGQGLPEVTVEPIPIPGTDHLAFSMYAYAGIGILTATSEDGSALAYELLLPPGGAAVRSSVEAFLAARVAGAGADAFLARGAIERFGHGLGALAPLYGSGPGYTGFSLAFIDGPFEGSYEVGVLLRVGDGPPVGETLFVGPGIDDSGLAQDLLVVGGRTGLTGP
jgi:hypothetical protein